MIFRRFSASPPPTIGMAHGASVEVTLAVARRLLERGHLDEAFRIGSDVLRAHPRHLAASLLLAEVAVRVGRRDDAAGLLREALAASPFSAPAHVLLGALNEEEEEVHVRRAVLVAPCFAPAWLRLGILLVRSDRPAAAEAAFRRAWRSGADSDTVVMSEAVARSERGDLAGAAAVYRRALGERPGFAEARFNAAVLAASAGRTGSAVDQLRRTAAVAPQMAVAQAALGRQLARRGEVEAAITAHRRAEILEPAEIRNADDGLFLRLTQPGLGNDGLAAAVEGWSARFGRMSATVRHPNRRDPDRPLRIGYVGTTFDRRHSVGYFLGPLLDHHDRRSFSVHFYGDAASARTPNHRCTADLPPEAVAGLIRADGIDVAIHLLGRAYNDDRSLAFLRDKPAPVQVALHHCMTTGMESFDLFLGDRHVTPRGSTEPFTERVLRLPRLFVFAPPTDAPAVAPSPLLRSGVPTLGFTGSAWKINGPTLALWAAALRRLPAARLALKLPGLEEEELRNALLRQLAAQGIAAERVLCAAPMERFADHLSWYGQIDIALDSLPYGAGNTMLEALWMGVPMPAPAGDRFAGRMGLSILSTAGLDGWVARSPTDYAEIVAGLAADPARLAAIREGLRAVLATSPLMDGAGYTRHVERACRAVWRRWCASDPSGG